MVFEFYRGGREGEDFGPPPPPFRIRRRRDNFGGLGSYNRWIFVGVALLLVYIILNVLRGLYVDWLWFDGAGYRSVYSKVLTTRLWLFFGGAGLFLAYFVPNVYIAGRAVMHFRPGVPSDLDAASLRRLYQLGLIAGSIFLAIIFGTIASDKWDIVLRFLNGQSFGVEDPQLHRDVGFFVFTLPALRFFQGWLLGVAVITVLVVAGLYLSRFLLVGARREDERPTKTHLALLLVAIVALFVWRYWLNTFELDFSTNGTVFGATYTDVHARLPFIWVSAAMAVLTAAALLVSIVRPGVFLPMAAMGAWVAVSIFGTVFYPSFVQRFTVQPNELEKERPYIERNIEMTRRAFELDQIDEKQFPAAPEVTQQEIAENPETIQNIRLLDVRPLLDTYAQIQTIRPLYEFNDVDIDRYVIDGQRRQVMLSARELSPGRLPVDGAELGEQAPAVHARLRPGDVTRERSGAGRAAAALRAGHSCGGKDRDRAPRDLLRRRARPLRHRQHQGEGVRLSGRARPASRTYSRARAASSSARSSAGSLFAWQFGDINIAISDSLTNDSRLLWRRNIKDRVETLAPFLTLDHDPYLVVADGKLYWIQDAYTTTNRYPYSTAVSGLPSTNPLNGDNYVRNSVKVVVDAYDGTDDASTSPMTPTRSSRTYAKIFPKLFTPLERHAGLAPGAPALPGGPVPGPGERLPHLPHQGPEHPLQQGRHLEHPDRDRRVAVRRRSSLTT